MKSIKVPEEYKYISAFLTMRCNLKCSYCLNTFEEDFKRKREEISGEDWVKSLNRLNSRNDLPITFSGGEPTLHNDFIHIINNLKPELNIDILTNLYWGKEFIDKFISQIDPKRINRNSPYPSIRVSYHPEQMGNGEKLIENAKKIKNAGFNLGIYSVQYPSPNQLEAITQMQFRCAKEDILFRIKDYTGKYEGQDDKGNEFSIIYGNYAKFPGSSFQEGTKNCECRTTELLIGPNGNVYKCHHDVYGNKSPIDSILNPSFEVEYTFRDCDQYGKCHPCDVKVKTNYKQELGHTSVEIRNIK